MNDRQIETMLAEARSYVAAKVRFRHQGRSRNGVDCAGLVFVSLSAAGRPPIDMQSYGREPLGGRLRAHLALNFEPVAKEFMAPGDVVLMRFRGEPCHVAIVGDYTYGGLSLIHSYAQVKKCVEHRIDDEWNSYIVEVFRP
ncbi:NlpC/P60 family protein [Dyella kyungheensis]|uniref:NlpC/P60 family protein n=1 Tax=Dyella kyungheensis TaxID=1242174 RepID=UPI003CF70DFC